MQSNEILSLSVEKSYVFVGLDWCGPKRYIKQEGHDGPGSLT